ncbi:hypothetical protein [Paracoccus seriniphilus]|uniref:Succinate dehydrogenase n=1 Tax=Paracoccus seriniphilus TaxID=184748 RepID=A0A239PQW2_9RHOB|nr:hypothetical protein [Paracoccus seriniphilus]WCR12901.1 hypothetical protein JHW44_08005 [Paracoccus seriniphilus]SNT72669.1 hypothetical protein SAMN05444959_103167 [Paracoccus seriniphilus]
MRFQLTAISGVVALALAGCVAPLPMATSPTTAPATTTTPTVLDAASRQAARTAINSEMQKRLPGVNVQPYTDCVVNNATTAEMIDIARLAASDSTGAANSVAAIVSRPATTQCIASAASAAAT